MQKYEFMDYQKYSQDQSDPLTKYNPIASATVRVDGKYVLTYVFKSFQDKAPYWSEISTQVSQNGVRSSLKGCVIDSRYEDKALIDFIKSNVLALTTQSGGVAADEQLPF